MIPLNQQPSEKQVFRKDGALDVFDIWKTIQGEGPLAGRPATFVRLAGCNLRCAGCDTDYTSKRKLMTVDEVFSEIIRVNEHPEVDDPDLIVFTGGEPLRQNLIPMMFKLSYKAIHYQIETNGTIWYDIPEECHEYLSIVCSPKTPHVNADLFPHVHAWKYVVRSGEVDENSGFPTKVLGTYRPWTPFLVGRNYRPFEVDRNRIFIQPMDEGDPVKNEANRKTAVEICLRFGYRLSLQIHKIIGVE